MNVTFLITTCHRKESCQRLVDALRGLGNIVVLEDGDDYFVNGCDVFCTQSHLGKQGYWATVNKLFGLRIPAKYYIMLPDDFLITPEMVSEAIRIWESIADDKKMCLNLYADRIGKPCWTKVVPIDMGEYYKTQWVDMCFICDESFFAALGGIPPVKAEWNRRIQRSSGVGRHISVHLYTNSYSMFQVKESLVIPQPEHAISQMKAE